MQFFVIYLRMSNISSIFASQAEERIWEYVHNQDE